MVFITNTRRRWRHVVRQTEYLELGRAKYIDDEIGIEGDTLVVFVNLAMEFITGRDQNFGQTHGLEFIRAQLQTKDGLVQDDIVVIYQSTDDGMLWARHDEEFEDGRFEEITP